MLLWILLLTTYFCRIWLWFSFIIIIIHMCNARLLIILQCWIIIFVTGYGQWRCTRIIIQINQFGCMNGHWNLWILCQCRTNQWKTCSQIFVWWTTWFIGIKIQLVQDRNFRCWFSNVWFIISIMMMITMMASDFIDYKKSINQLLIKMYRLKPDQVAINPSWYTTPHII